MLVFIYIMAGRRCFYGEGANTTSASLLFHSQRPEPFFLSAPSPSLIGMFLDLVCNLDDKVSCFMCFLLNVL